MRSSLLRWLGAALLVVGAAGCATTQARVQPEPPPLEPPPPPPRVIAAFEPDEPPTPAGQGDTLPSRGPARPARSRGEGARGESGATRPEAKKPEAAPPKVEPSSQAARPAGSEEPPAHTTLQTAPAASDSEAERKIRQVLARAGRDLGRVDYGGLNVDARAQYDTAKRFIEQADEALKGRNFMFANQLADKAATLAGTLLGR